MIDLVLLEYQSYLFKEEMDNIFLEHMEAESDLIAQCIENYEPVTEVRVEKQRRNIISRIIYLIQKVIDFVKNLFDKFKSNAMKFHAKNNKWIERNAETIKTMSYEGLSYEMYNYWTANDKDTFNILHKIESYIDDAMNDNKIKQSEGSMAEFEKRMERDGLKTPGVTIKESLLKRFRIGVDSATADFRVSRLDDPQTLANLCQTNFLPYVQNFPDFIKRLQEVQKVMNTRLDRVKRALDRAGYRVVNKDNKLPGGRNDRTVQDAYCSVENMPWANIVTEVGKGILAEADTNNNDTQNNNQRSTNNSNPTQVKDNNANNTNDGNKEPQGKTTVRETQPTERIDVNQTYDNLSQSKYNYLMNCLTINKLAIGCAMNVAIERYSAYMNILKKVVSKA